MELLGDPDQLRTALDPLRRRLLERLRTPASATELAAELDMPRQKLNYHLRRLESAGLLELVETRRRRGCTERVMQTCAGVFVVDPDVLGPPPATDSARHAADHLVGVATQTVRDVVRMQGAADRTGTRLLTYTLESEVRFASPSDVHRFTEALAEAIATVAEQFDSPDGRRYRVVAGGYPAPHSERPPS